MMKIIFAGHKTQKTLVHKAELVGFFCCTYSLSVSFENYFWYLKLIFTNYMDAKYFSVSHRGNEIDLR